MTRNKKIIQLTLAFFGFFLILTTYFLYPKIKEGKLLKKETLQDEIVKTDSDDKEKNTFENVEYKGLYNVSNPFTIKSEKAYILSGEPDLVYMSNMHVSLHLNDGRIVIIVSEKGTYNKTSYDMYFENNVKATDSETVILAQNIDLLASEDKAFIYNNVDLKNDKGSLKADKIDYNFETKFYKISMFDDNGVKMKLIQ